MVLVVDPSRSYHVALDTVQELEEAIAQSETDLEVHSVSERDRRIWGLLTKARLADVFQNFRRIFYRGLRNEAFQFAVMMGSDERKIAFAFDHRRRRAVYLFDAWPSRIPEIVTMVRRFYISYLFVSSSQAADLLARELPDCIVKWVPEGIAPSHYRYRSLMDKDIDVLQLGRRHESYHLGVVSGLEGNGKSYLFESSKGHLIFPTRESFVEGLARARISICFPSSVTHPERAGGFETMTVRFLQSMVSGCVVVGHAPAEMLELFGYNPVVEADLVNPAGQLIYILDNINRYASLVTRNLETVNSMHTWQSRWAIIRAALRIE